MKIQEVKGKSEFENMFGLELGETQIDNKPTTFILSDRSKEYKND